MISTFHSLHMAALLVEPTSLARTGQCLIATFIAEKDTLPGGGHREGELWLAVVSPCFSEGC